jgi:hypothetical protein
MICPWVSTAAVPITTSESAGTADLSNAVSGSSAAARSACHCSLRERTCCCQAVGLVMPASSTAWVSAASARFASATIPVAPSRPASCTLTLMVANRTSGFWNNDCEAVAKSVSRDPTVRTRSAAAANSLVAGVPSNPIPPNCHQARCCTAPLPANVSATGIPAAAASASNSEVAPE